MPKITQIVKQENKVMIKEHNVIHSHSNTHINIHNNAHGHLHNPVHQGGHPNHPNEQDNDKVFSLINFLDSLYHSCE